MNLWLDSQKSPLPFISLFPCQNNFCLFLKISKSLKIMICFPILNITFVLFGNFYESIYKTLQHNFFVIHNFNMLLLITFKLLQPAIFF